MKFLTFFPVFTAFTIFTTFTALLELGPPGAVLTTVAAI